MIGVLPVAVPVPISVLVSVLISVLAAIPVFFLVLVFGLATGLHGWPGGECGHFSGRCVYGGFRKVLRMVESS